MRAPCAVSIACAALLACGGGGGSSDGGGGGGPPYTVSGTMYAAAGSAIDSDTNDRSAPFVRNDNAGQAQFLPNPVSLGGHLNRAGVGHSGRTSSAGDLQDWFRVALAVGQTIRLQIAEDGSANDLDLQLRALDGTLIANSTTASRTEEISVPATDDYYVVVLVKSGASNYTLTIGQVPTSGSAALPREPEFVPGQVLVRYRDDRGRSARDGATRARGVGMRHVSGESGGPMLFAAETVPERRHALEVLGVPGGPRGARDDTRRIAAALRARSEVRSADLNYVRRAEAAPDDEFYPFQWHYDQINLPQAWDVTTANSGVIVAVVDTGVKQGHPDLTNQLVPGFDFISNPATANDGDGCDGDPEDPGDQAPSGSSYHGTHVTGTVAARTSFSSGDATGVAGVAWNARVMPLRVLGIGGGTDSDIMEALRYAAGRFTACAGPGAPNRARIVNLSLSGPGYSQTFQDLITDLRANEGTIFVAAAGNSASSQPEYPAGFAGVISVSAVGPTRTLAPYSNYGATIDVAAPGGDFQRDVDGDGFPDGVLSTFYQDGRGYGYAFYQGTSMAVPHVAGVIALMLGINPALTPFDIDNALNAGQITENIGSSQFFGHGLIDAARAVNRAAAGGGGATVIDPVLRIDPDALNFGVLASEFVLSASNGGNDQQPLNVLGASFTSDDGANWLVVTPSSVNASGLGAYRATVNRSGLADGLYTGTIHFDSDRNDVDVAVIMQVGNASAAQADAGHQYILLVKPGTLETVAIREANASNGSYGFSFSGVSPGDYVLVAGSDSDGDTVVCDPGEACGAFPTTETIVPITVNGNRTNLQFTTGFEVDVGASISSVAPARPGYSTEPGATPPAP